MPSKKKDLAMTKLKLGILRKYNALIAILLSALGFSTACDPTPGMEYGVPHAAFVVKGTVESFNNAAPIPDIKVKMGYDSTYTDTDGKFEVANSGFPVEQTFQLEVSDVDGAANDEFNAVDTAVVFNDPEFSGGSGEWYEGKTEKEINIKLKSRP